MIIAPSITFYGGCRQAVDLYEKVFPIVSREIVTFGEADDTFASFLTSKNRDYIHLATLSFECGTVITLRDSFTLLMSPMDAKTQGNRDNIIFDVYNLSEDELLSIYGAFMEHGAVSNTAPAPKDDSPVYASLIDPFVVCWNLYGRRM